MPTASCPGVAASSECTRARKSESPRERAFAFPHGARNAYPGFSLGPGAPTSRTPDTTPVALSSRPPRKSADPPDQPRPGAPNGGAEEGRAADEDPSHWAGTATRRSWTPDDLHGRCRGARASLRTPFPPIRACIRISLNSPASRAAPAGNRSAQLLRVDPPGASDQLRLPLQADVWDPRVESIIAFWTRTRLIRRL